MTISGPPKARYQRAQKAVELRTTVDVKALARAIRAGDRAALARAITLIESKRADHQAAARDWCRSCCRRPARRSASASPASPGVGKSTTIDALGTYPDRHGPQGRGARGRSVLGAHRRLDPRRQDAHGAAVATDATPSSAPRPPSGTLGGVAAKTRETMLLCEAAGFDVILVETVGIGQSETAVADMTDFFLVLMLPGAGDELQGIKKGVVELADMIAVNKADGDNIKRANAAAAEYRARAAYPHAALATLVAAGRHLFGAHRRRASPSSGRRCSIIAQRMTPPASSPRDGASSRSKWMWSMLEERMLARLRADTSIRARVKKIESEVADGRLTPAVAAEQILELL